MSSTQFIQITHQSQQIAIIPESITSHTCCGHCS